MATTSTTPLYRAFQHLQLPHHRHSRPELLPRPHRDVAARRLHALDELVRLELEPLHRVHQLGVVDVDAVVVRLPRHGLERLAERHEVHLRRLEDGRVPEPPVREGEERARQVHRPELQEGPPELVVSPLQAREFGGQIFTLSGGLGHARRVGGAPVGLDGPYRVFRHEGRGLGPDGQLESVQVRRVGHIPRPHRLSPLGQQLEERGGGVRDDLVGQVVQHHEQRVRVLRPETLVAEHPGPHGHERGGRADGPALGAARFDDAVHVGPVGHQLMQDERVPEVAGLVVYAGAVAASVEEAGVEHGRLWRLVVRGGPARGLR
ncbi:uncharacterized protein PG986_010726 [Apiospora aurea]|uniref:Uncharacterized protein n=1 Tax=Apiospora aurea TaxID=335848 RepID=A0ABR1Q372_9PEZI